MNLVIWSDRFWYLVTYKTVFEICQFVCKNFEVVVRTAFSHLQNEGKAAKEHD